MRHGQGKKSEPHDGKSLRCDCIVLILYAQNVNSPTNPLNPTSSVNSIEFCHVSVGVAQPAKP